MSCKTRAYETGLLYSVAMSENLLNCQMEPVVAPDNTLATTALFPIVVEPSRPKLRNFCEGVGTQDCGTMAGLSPGDAPPTPNCN